MTEINDYETVGDFTHYIHGREARNSASLVCRKWRDFDWAKRKHVKVHLYYAPSPSRLAERFPFIESLSLKGLPDKDKFPHTSNIDVTSWIKEIAVKFKGLKSLHFRNLAIHDSDLELLSRTRGRDLKILKIHRCGGFSEIGLTYISKSCNELRTFILDDVMLDNAKDGKWLHEFASRNTAIETFDFSNYHHPFDAKNCSQSLLQHNCISLDRLGVHM